MNLSAMHNLFNNVRDQAKIYEKCSERINNPNPDENYECFDDYCLFDLHHDPCEYKNVANQNKYILNMTIDRLNEFKKNLVEQNRPEYDPNADPRCFNGYWDTWMDYNKCNLPK